MWCSESPPFALRWGGGSAPSLFYIKAATDVTNFIAFGNIFSKNVHTPFKRS
jgi:hypothetical protein